MESRAFFEAFAYVPGPLARALDQVLAWRNQRGLDADEERHLRVYRTYAEQFQGSADIVVIRPCPPPGRPGSSEPAPDRSGRLAAPFELPENRRSRGRPFTSSTIATKSPRAEPAPRQPSLTHRESLMKFDHHMHTRKHSPDSEIDPLLLIERAREIGLDGVVITEHDYQWEADELAELAARAAPLRVFSGAEISAREGHFLVYGLPSLDEVPAGVALADLLETVQAPSGRHRGRASVSVGPAVRRDRRRTWPGLRRTRAGEQ